MKLIKTFLDIFRAKKIKTVKTDFKALEREHLYNTFKILIIKYPIIHHKKKVW